VKKKHKHSPETAELFVKLWEQLGKLKRAKEKQLASDWNEHTIGEISGIEETMRAVNDFRNRWIFAGNKNDS